MKPLSLNKPHLIIMVGIPGSGKSFFADNFSDSFKAPIISLDNVRQKLFATPKYDKAEDDIVNRVALYMLNEMLKTERTVIFDGNTSSRKDRDPIVKKAKSIGYEPLFVWVQTEPITAKKRATKLIEEKFKLTPAQFDAKLKQFEIPARTDSTVVISGKHTYSSQLKIVLNHLVGPRTQSDAVKKPERHNILVG